MAEKYLDLLIAENRRVFIDVAYRGCGSGCKYCYVPSASEEQVLASYEELTKMVHFLSANDMIEHQIISFCPNTEPFKSRESAERVLFIIEKIKDYQCYIQISTKEYIEDDILRELERLAGDRTIFINISMPFLNSVQIEPCAADIQMRVKNMERIARYTHLKCGLYIKPCTKSAVDNVCEYIEIIKKTLPDYVCIGVAFNKKTEVPCTSLYHKEDAEVIITAQQKTLKEFALRIESISKCYVVYSSICAIAQIVQCGCMLDIGCYDKDFCKGCTFAKNKYPS